MIKLLNYGIYSPEYTDPTADRQITELAAKYNLDGFELSRYDGWEDNRELPAGIKGIHMKFLPIWLDFWRGNEAELLRQFGSKESYVQYYGGTDKSILVQQCRNELIAAEKLNVEYVVFHVCHMELEHCYSYQFTYSDMEVASAFIEFLNETLQGLELSFQILFENTWWPGLKLLDSEVPKLLIDGIAYPRKGFMLDIGHMMNSNLLLKTEKQGIAWIEKTLDSLGEYAGYIRGIHLHSSLSGDYVLEMKAKCKDSISRKEGAFMERYIASFAHIAKIDLHLPFRDSSVTEIIRRIKPSYLVHEFTTSSFDILNEYLKLQEDTLVKIHS